MCGHEHPGAGTVTEVHLGQVDDHSPGMVAEHQVFQRSRQAAQLHGIDAAADGDDEVVAAAGTDNGD
jgi:hypothetical protein